ncbi:MAG TPA: VOC family protein [Saprospiraceae bacterium]|nr:VOC family protein [Saprospiraceae bacterium]HMQ82633.1 VOC family protein [Saprospiraceae bacterium]
MTTANIYLTFDGNCEEAFKFYHAVFGSETPNFSRFKDMPPSEEGKAISAEEGDKIMHVSLPISQETMIMGSDTGGEWAAHHKAGNNFSISISTDSKEEADRLFNGLSAGGQVTMPMADTFWGDYFGMFTDKFGINWMVGYNSGQQA